MKYNSDLLLDINTSTVPSESDFSWKFNQNVNVVKFNKRTEPEIVGKYKSSVEFFKQNYSLLLKNVQHEDSGVYKAIKSADADEILVEYDVTVQGKVLLIGVQFHRHLLTLRLSRHLTLPLFLRSSVSS